MDSQRIKRKPGRWKKESPGFSYLLDSRYAVLIANGMEDIASKELSELGAKDITPAVGSIHFRADKKSFYHINYTTRLASRCLAPLASFVCPDPDTLYQRAKQIKWEALFAPGKTFAVAGHVSASMMSHSKYAALRLKDAVVDYFREKTGNRPDVSARDPDIQLHLSIRKNQAQISLDTSGGPLHKRGYREETISAPLQETVAAAIIRFSEWNGTVPLYDPLCGSGTLLCEALMHYCNIPAGIFRARIGVAALPDFDASLWKLVKSEADNRIRELPEGLVAGSDVSKEAVAAARTNLMGIHYGKHVRVHRADFRQLPAVRGQVIVANPPYGIRMGKNEDLNAFYKDLGDFLKQKCIGSTAYLYFGEREYLKKIGLKAAWKKPIRSGGLDGRLAKYEMY